MKTRRAITTAVQRDQKMENNKENFTKEKGREESPTQILALSGNTLARAGFAQILVPGGGISFPLQSRDMWFLVPKLF